MRTDTDKVDFDSCRYGRDFEYRAALLSLCQEFRAWGYGANAKPGTKLSAEKLILQASGYGCEILPHDRVENLQAKCGDRATQLPAG